MSNDYETAEAFSRSRARMAPFMGLLVLLVQQGYLFSWDWGSQSVLQIAVWLALSAIMLALLLGGDSWLLSRRARSLVNDEPTKLNRMRAIRIGFFVAMFVGFMIVAVSPFEPISAQRAANILVSTSLGCTFLAFGFFERATSG